MSEFYEKIRAVSTECFDYGQTEETLVCAAQRIQNIKEECTRKYISSHRGLVDHIRAGIIDCAAAGVRWIYFDLSLDKIDQIAGALSAEGFSVRVNTARGVIYVDWVD